jgi:arginase
VRIDVPPYCDVRDVATGLLNPRGIATVALDLAASVGAALDEGRFPVVLGGDCSILLGPMLALRRRGRYGLVFIDGHADFQHPSDEPTGEVASLDLALVTGRGPELLADLDGLRPLVRDEDVALVGYRAFGDNDHVLDEHVRDTVSRPGTEGFWVHLDVDVLDDGLMPAVDYRTPGGLTWDEAAEILGGLLDADGARGLEVTIFNPLLDADGSLAQRLSGLITSAMPGSRNSVRR